MSDKHEENERLAKAWYNEQRGRVVGNTKSWDELSLTDKVQIRIKVWDLYERMSQAWRKE